MIPGLRGRASPIVFDIGSAAVRVAQRASGEGGCRVLTLRREDTDTPLASHEAAGLTRAMLRARFAVAEAVIIAPRAMVRSLPVELPPASSGAPLLEIARSRAAELLDMPPAAFELAITSTPPDQAQARTSTVATCKHDDAETLIAVLESAGVRVRSLIAPSAAAAAVAPAPTADDPDAACLLLDVGWRETAAIGLAGGRPVFERHLRKLGFGAVVRSVRDELDVPWDLARHLAVSDRQTNASLAEHVSAAVRSFGVDLLREAEATLSYLERLAEPGRVREVLIAGGGAEDDELLDWLAANLSVPVRTLREALDLDPHLPAGHAVAVALCAGLSADAVGRVA